MKKLKNSLPLLLVLSLIVAALNLIPVHASPGDVSVLFPNTTTISVNEYPPGSMFSVDIYAADINDLFGFEFKLKYDPTVLTAIDVIIGDFLLPDYQEWYKEVNGALGYVWYAVTQVTGEVGASGYGTLALIIFSVNGPGATILDLTNSLLVDSNAAFMDFVANSGLYSNIGYPPVVSFTVAPENPELATSVIFDASASYDPDGTIVSYAWDFGDGFNATTTTPIIEHVYEAIGTYRVILIVTDNAGAKAIAEATLTVFAPSAVKADLSDWKAKPAHRNFDISRRGNVNTFYAIVTNMGNISTTLTVKVVFDVYDANTILVRTVETNEYTFAPHTYLQSTDTLLQTAGNWDAHGLNTTSTGQFDVTGITGTFYVMARAYYKVPGGTYTAGIATKSFRFTVKP